MRKIILLVIIALILSAYIPVEGVERGEGSNPYPAPTEYHTPYPAPVPVQEPPPPLPKEKPKKVGEGYLIPPACRGPGC